MFVAAQLVAGLAGVHLAWCYFFLCGTILQTPALLGRRAVVPPANRGDALLRLVALSASGIAITAFATFVFGVCRLLYPAAAVVWLAMLAGAFTLLGDSPVRPAFWSVRVALVREALSRGAAVVYAGALVLAVPAILPETNYDPLSAYDVLAYEWAQRHEIFVDMFRRSPFYASNWVLADVWAFAFGDGTGVPFLTWLTGCLSLLGVYAYVVAAWNALRMLGANAARFAEPAGVIAGVSLGASPIFLRWLDTGMTDVQTGLFFFVAAVSAAAAYLIPWRGWLAQIIVCGAFLIGIKSSLLVFFPAFALAAYAVSMRVDGRRRAAVTAVCLLAVLSAPWYVKNFVEDGDPIAPVLNIAFHGVDRKYDKADVSAVLQDLKPVETPVDKLLLPYEIVENTASTSFREYGTTWLLALVALPGAFVVYRLLRWRSATNADSAMLALAALLLFAVGYWLQTSSLGRYTLLFSAALAAFVPIALLYRARPGVSAYACAAIAVLCAIPASSQAATYLHQVWDDKYVSIATVYRDRQTYLATHLGGYTEAEYVANRLLAAPHSSRRVYVVNGQDLAFTFASRGIVAIGDWFGPERYADLDAAIERGDAVRHLRRFDIDAVLIPSTAGGVPVELQPKLFAELRSGGYRGVVLPNSVYHIFFARTIPAGPAAKG